MIEVKDTVFEIGNPIRVGKVVAMAGNDVQVVFFGTRMDSKVETFSG